MAKSQIPPSDATRMHGKVLRWTPDKGFGFIKGTDGVQYFFHRSTVEGTDPDAIQIDDPVTFEPSSSPKGPRAEHVEFV